MKKLIGVGILVAVGVGLIAVAPMLLDLYRLTDFIATSSRAYEIDGGPWPHLTDVCEGCHGAAGNPIHQGYPGLAGQPKGYLETQLRHFASGERRNPTMGPLALSMSEADIHLLAGYFAGKPALANRAFEADAARQAQGARLVESQGCAACHGDSFAGRDGFPRLASQGHDYLLRQLDAYADGSRIEATGTMQRMARSMSSDEREAVATYLASLPPK